jgi:hypothetical protein
VVICTCGDEKFCSVVISETNGFALTKKVWGDERAEDTRELRHATVWRCLARCGVLKPIKQCAGLENA